MSFQKDLHALGACQDAREWVETRGFKRSWQQCRRADWMIWFAERMARAGSLDVRLPPLAAFALLREVIARTPTARGAPFPHRFEALTVLGNAMEYLKCPPEDRGTRSLRASSARIASVTLRLPLVERPCLALLDAFWQCEGGISSWEQFGWPIVDAARQAQSTIPPARAANIVRMWIPLEVIAAAYRAWGDVGVKSRE